MSQEEQQQSNNLETLRQLRDTSLQSKEDLDNYLRVYYGVYLAKKTIEKGNSNPLDFVWDIYNTAIHGTENSIYNFLGVATRGGQKCAEENELVFTTNGAKKIKDVEVGDMVISYPSPQKVIGKFCNGVREVYQIVSHLGYSLICTDNHRIAYWDNGIKYKELKNLDGTEYLLLSGYKNIEDRQEIVEEDFYFSGIENNSHKRLYDYIVLPTKLDFDLGYLLGVVVGDGCTTIKNRIDITCDENIIKKCAVILKNKFNFDSKYKKMSDRNCYLLTINNKKIKEYLNFLGIENCKAIYKSIPDIIFGANEKFQLGFISGFFDTDGSINKQVYKSKYSVRWGQGSQKIIKDLQLLLMRWGILSRYSYQKTSKGFNSYNLEIKSEFAYKFCKIIKSFGYKNKRIQKLLARNMDNITGINFPVILIDQLVSKIKKHYFENFRYKEKIPKKYIRTTYSFGCNNISFKKIRKILLKYQKSNQLEEYKILAQLVNGDFRTDRIKIIKKMPEKAKVYDLEIEKNHNFVCNGLLVHNSLSCGVLETLLLTHDKYRDFFHMASIIQQSKVTYNYVQNFYKNPIIQETIEKCIMSETRSRFNKQLVIGTGTMDSVNSFHGCISGDSLIATNTGFITLRDFYNKKYKPSFIAGINKGQKYNKIIYSGNKPITKIILENGIEIDATESHSFLLFENGFIDKNLKDINVGDELLLNKYIKFTGTNSLLEKYWFSDRIKSFDKNLCYLLGLLVGDGSVQDFYGRFGNIFSFHNSDKKLKDQFYKIMLELFYYTPKLQNDKTYYVNDKIIKRYLCDILGMGRLRCNKKIVPNIILNAPKKMFYQFLSGYWDTDGTISKRNNISFCSTSKKLLQTIQQFLLHDGIFSYLRVHKTENPKHNFQYYLDIYSMSCDRLVKRLETRGSSNKNIRLKKKQDELKDINIDRIQPNSYIKAENIQKLISHIRSIYNKKSRLQLCDFIDDNRTNFSYKDRVSFKKIKQFLQNYYICHEEKSWQNLLQLCFSHLCPFKIKKIIRNYNTSDVYDIEMESKDNPYWAPNGVIVHNSTIQDEVDLTPAAVFKESKGMLTAQNGKLALNVCISSRKFAFGNVQHLLDRAKRKKYPLKIHKWSILEITEHCSAQRSGEYGEIYYVDEENLNVLTEREFLNITNIDKREKYEKIIGYKNCGKCGIFSFCKGNLKNQDEGNDYLQPIEQVRNLFFTDDVFFFQSQRLNRKPSSKGLVFPMWEEYNHVKTFNQMYKILTGVEYSQEKELTFEQMAKIFIQYNCRSYIGIDFGFNNARALLAFVDGSDRVYVVDEIAVTGLSDNEFAYEAKEQWDFMRAKIYNGFPDIASPGGAKEFSKYFRMIEDKEYNKLSKIPEFRAGWIRKKLKAGGTSLITLYIHPNCGELRSEMPFYHYIIDEKTEEPTDRIQKKNDHSIDSLGNLLIGIFALEQETQVVIAEEDKKHLDQMGKLLEAPTATELAKITGRGEEFTDDKKPNDEDDVDTDGINFDFA